MGTFNVAGRFHGEPNAYVVNSSAFALFGGRPPAWQLEPGRYEIEARFVWALGQKTASFVLLNETDAPLELIGESGPASVLDVSTFTGATKVEPATVKPPIVSTGSMTPADQALAGKITAWFAQYGAVRRERARIRAWLSLRESLGREPSGAQLAAASRILEAQKDDELEVTEPEIRAYFAAGGVPSPDLQPWNAQTAKSEPTVNDPVVSPSRSSTTDPVNAKGHRDKKDVDREINHWIDIGEQLVARITRQDNSTSSEAEWGKTARDLHEYLNHCLGLLYAERVKYHRRLSNRLHDPPTEKSEPYWQREGEISESPQNPEDGWAYYLGNRGGPLRERAQRAVDVLRDALEDEASK